MGGVSLLLFCAAFSYAPYPGGCQTIHLPYSGLHPQGFTVSSYPAATFNELFARIIRASRPHQRRLSRFITVGGPCRFCVIAVTLATRTCVRLRGLAGGRTFLSSTGYVPPSAALSLSYILFTGGNIYLWSPVPTGLRTPATDPGRPHTPRRTVRRPVSGACQARWMEGTSSSPR